ncbi:MULTISPECIES: ThiF family adenylyltransferase [Oerskovia]|uniref:ThiF family adenylyltransferase n=1 Tax=Oerskovia gallyi TaxID=2762226 RepID=A0ABR8UYL7_9CELL|nr:ThiF family adenylyltransferase [Oerskovia gallyi]MBD7997646.1 ThiF family adenylyltransferase [Oerskovia gallyi]
MDDATFPVRLRPGTVVLRREPGTLQYGTDERWSVLLSGLGDQEAAWLLDHHRSGRPLLHAPPARYGVDPERQRVIVRHLHEAFLVVGAPDAASREVVAPAHGGADAPTLALLRPDGSGRATLARRAQASVGVEGLGRLGLGVAVVLATAGVGTLLLDDAAPVQATDVGLGGYRTRDVGRPRGEAAARILTDLAPEVRSHLVEASRWVAPHAGRPDVAVVVEHRVLRPERYGRLTGDGTPHLPVVVREADVVVGPFVRPGRTPCVRCVEGHRADLDPQWPQLVDQLRDPQREVLDVEETTLAAVGAAIAASQVLAHLDGLTPRAASACIEIAVPDAVPRLREVVNHPRCGCSDLTVAAAMSGRR